MPFIVVIGSVNLDIVATAPCLPAAGETVTDAVSGWEGSQVRQYPMFSYVALTGRSRYRPSHSQKSGVGHAIPTLGPHSEWVVGHIMIVIAASLARRRTAHRRRTG